jgi:anti-anti-sigma factor
MTLPKEESMAGTRSVTVEVADSVSGVTVIALRGRLDANTAEAVRAQLLDVAAASDRLVLDVTGLDYVSSGGLRVLLLLARTLQQSGGGFALCGARPVVTDVLCMTGLQTILRNYPDSRRAAEELAVR